MGNEESNQNPNSDNEEHPDQIDSSNFEESIDKKPSTPINSFEDDQSSEPQDLKKQLEKLKNHLSVHQDQAQEKEQIFEKLYSTAKSELEKIQGILQATKLELEEKKQLLETKELEHKRLGDRIFELEEEFNIQLQAKKKHNNNLEEELRNTKLSISEFEFKSQEKDSKIQELYSTIEALQLQNTSITQEKETYLMQISKLQDVIQSTEEEIKEIEENHNEIEEQLKLEIQRTEKRAGKISEDLSRETSGSLARNRHIRIVLQESDIGKIILFIVDYFEDSKKRALELQTLASEVGMTPIIVRSHLRNLHGLGVCEFNEVTREIKLKKYK
jgi:chromosome segregation ATPase